MVLWITRSTFSPCWVHCNINSQCDMAIKGVQVSPNAHECIFLDKMNPWEIFAREY